MSETIDFGEWVGNIQSKEIGDCQGWFSNTDTRPAWMRWKLGEPLNSKILRKKHGRREHVLRVQSERSLRREMGTYRPSRRDPPGYFFGRFGGGSPNFQKQVQYIDGKRRYRTRLGNGPWSRWKSEPAPKGRMSNA